MDPKFQSSFIPKKAITADQGVRASSTVNLFFLIAVISFILTLGAGAFLMFINYQQNKDIGVIADSLIASEKKEFSETDVKAWTRLDGRIAAATQILQKHIAVSTLFEILQETTIKNVQFNKFDFSTKLDNAGKAAAIVSLAGQGRNFNSVSYQSDVFRDTSAFTDTLFSDVRLDDKGNVLFQVNASIYQDALLYRKLIK